MMSVTSAEASEITLMYSTILVAQYLIFCQVLCGSLSLWLHFWALHCLPFRDERLRIIPLISANFLFIQMLLLVANLFLLIQSIKVRENEGVIKNEQS